DDIKDIMGRYRGRELELYVAIRAEGARAPVGCVRIVREVAEFKETDVMPTGVGDSDSEAQGGERPICDCLVDSQATVSIAAGVSSCSGAFNAAAGS
ncbi:unnamed protein product, partial [Prorocentrum cordatum]